MVRVHSTRLMRNGEVALWHDGRVVWRGAVGTHLEAATTFDTIMLHAEDGKRLSARLQRRPTAKQVLEAVATWWD
jgi:hypothetical protein